MSNWYKQKAVFSIALSCFFSKSVEIKAFKNLNVINSSYNQLLENVDSNNTSKTSIQFTEEAGLFPKKYVERQMQLISLSNTNTPSNRNSAKTLEIDNWLARQQDSCQNIAPAYQQVYSFQTDSYYISICQLEDNFYYHRQSKFDDEDTVLIPARAISHGGVFQATSKGTTYFVGKNGDRYYSSVMQNDNEIVFEPELPPSTDAVLARDIAQINSQLPAAKVESDRATNASLELNPVENYAYSSQQTFCTGANTSNSYLNSWQELLGESLYTASQYAFNNGYSFVYDARTPEQASIATSAAIVNLNIAAQSNTIEQVCIRSTVQN